MCAYISLFISSSPLIRGIYVLQDFLCTPPHQTKICVMQLQSEISMLVQMQQHETDRGMELCNVECPHKLG